MKVGAIVVAAGSGERLGAGVPKGLVMLGNRPLLEWAVSAFSAHRAIECTVVVAPASHLAEVAALVGDRAVVVPGGASRKEAILVHDAARPLVPAEMIGRVIDQLAAGSVAVTPVIAVADTIKRVDAAGTVLETLDRSALRATQTPQGFARATLIEAHAGAAPDAGATDDAGLIEAAGIPVQTVAGSALAFKITTAHDLRVAEALLAVQTLERALAGQDGLR
jgi:2-C-methyl-D-erythritol 4-phosphate cytidylyltransferase